MFIDLKKAFDTIDHGLLMDKLYHYGIRGLAYDWVENYLQDRQQYVSLDNIKSESQRVRCGVPQGSILGPQLFILYINDICNVSHLLNFVIFADDTNVFYSHKDINILCQTMSNELNYLCTWFAANKLSLICLKQILYYLQKRKNCLMYKFI